MVKQLKLILALLLLPACLGSAEALGRIVLGGARADTVWVPILAGAGCWLAIYLLLPKPMLVYVFGHELTHALWTLAMGGRVRASKHPQREVT